MARYPGAKWRPVSGHTDGPFTNGRPIGVVLHVNESNGNLFNWVNGPHNVSCHFEVYKSGAVEQYLDTSVTSWCQEDGNAAYLSIETEGYHTQPFTGAQLKALAKLLAWIHTTHGIPLQLANKPGEHGFGWHGMGGAAWGNHPNCPGDKRRADRGAIIARAKVLTMPKATAVAKSLTAAQRAERAADQRRWKVYSAAGGKGPAYAAAPGHWRKLDAATFAAMVAHGECDGRIHLVHPSTLARLRRLCIGGNS